MKKLLLGLLFSLAFVAKAVADEGMWLPLLLGKQVYQEMVKKGLKLSKEQLYSINKASIKDAIVIFGSGCTGELVSPQGLIFTNHHCGYSVIAGASTLDHNYLKDGFYAHNKGEEIPGMTLSVQFLLKIEDVSKQVNDSLKGLVGEARAARQSSVLGSLNAAMSDTSNSLETRISPLFKSNQFLAFVYQVYRDVRLVGAPPEALGKFGGDTDNWEWPRHTADYSIFRVYATKEGKPARFSPANVALKPKWFLPVSLKGIHDGDFTMIYGYPGGTNRYESSNGIQLSTDINNPTLVKLREMRLKYMFDEMKKDPAIKLQLASDYASIANYWKFFDGETKQLKKYDVMGQKKIQENEFIKWAQTRPEYKDIFKDLDQTYSSWRPYAMQRVYLIEGILGSPLLGFAASLMQLENALVTPGVSSEMIKNSVEAANTARKNFLAKENKSSDQNIVAAVLQGFYNDIAKDQHPIGLYTTVKEQYGPLDNVSTFQKYAEAIFNNTILLNEVKWNAFIGNPNPNVLQQDIAYHVSSSFIRNWQGKYGSLNQQFTLKNNEWGRLYLKGIMEMHPNKIMYPDATFTMRVSFGQVKSYNPRDAVHYDYKTTLTGMVSKYIPEDYEFDLPASFLKIARQRDYGIYKDVASKDLVTCFITTNDITVGNSGSPVINATGALVGLAFDGNYEALSHKIAYDKNLNRTICVDIRFILWCVEKLGGATNIIQELTLK
ncbi:MAG: S46 family peptidase [Flavisolibacter sp.]